MRPADRAVVTARSAIRQDVARLRAAIRRTITTPVEETLRNLYGIARTLSDGCPSRRRVVRTGCLPSAAAEVSASLWAHERREDRP